ncbi:MAG: hypothetical protein EBX99_01745 [Acidimicrobiia bacterium]|jgi:hypothetical protein|nr:hypothetical protein [Acidimicrobiia bacterium]NDD98008.1 hypothetical protein [Actinomycetota bacterium]NDE81213.1 hypothetical protein [Actinomycetota bacterium]NDF30938.1 hypothetical protein [Acidimicrobiia bacterium]NDH46573.1 hypothetical protein [Acidimicrobiia bacterium]
MLDHVFTDVISALRDAFERAFLERQAFEEHFQVDVMLGDVTWETSYGLPGEGLPPRVVAHVTFDWPSWSQTAYRRWYVDEKMEDQPSIEMEVVLRIQRIKDLPDLDLVRAIVPTTSPLIGDGRLERAGLTLETTHLDDEGLVEHAVEATFEGLYELAEESLADGASTLLDDHFGALGGWVAAMLVKMGDVKYTFLPAD